MLSRSEPSVSLVTASHNRKQAIEATLEGRLAMCGVGELIFVLDGCADGTADFLREAQSSEPRIRIIEITRSGVQEARNIGARAATGEWILFIDDDDFAPQDYALRLLEEAIPNGAVLVGSPWLNAAGDDHERLAKLRREAARDSITLHSPISEFTRTPVDSPYMPSACLMRRDVALKFPFSRVYRGNGWREETDLFLRITESGLRVRRTSATYTWSEGRFSGGHSRAWLKYEWWTLVNEGVFHFRHRAYLAANEPRWRGWVINWLTSIAARHGRYLRMKWMGLWRKIRARVS